MGYISHLLIRYFINLYSRRLVRLLDHCSIPSSYVSIVIVYTFSNIAQFLLCMEILTDGFVRDRTDLKLNNNCCSEHSFCFLYPIWDEYWCMDKAYQRNHWYTRKKKILLIVKKGSQSSRFLFCIYFQCIDLFFT